MENEVLYQVDMASDELMHYGRKGMKWYQSIYGSKKSSGRKGGSDDDSDNSTPKPSRKELKQKRLEEKKRKEALEKARLAKEAKKRDAEEKEQIIKSGDRKKIIENKHRFTDDELKQAIARLDLEEKLTGPTAKKNIGKGEEVIREILTNSAKNIGSQTVSLLAGTATNVILKAIFDDPKMTVNPKKGQKDK